MFSFFQKFANFEKTIFKQHCFSRCWVVVCKKMKNQKSLKNLKM